MPTTGRREPDGAVGNRDRPAPSNLRLGADRDALPASTTWATTTLMSWRPPRHGATILPILFHAPEFHAGRVIRQGGLPAADQCIARGLRTGAGAALRAQRDALGRAPRGAAAADPLLADLERAEPGPPTGASKPNAKQYVAMLRTVGAAIKQVDPGAQIVTAGLPDSKLSGAVPLKRFIDQMYRAGARGTSTRSRSTPTRGTSASRTASSVGPQADERAPRPRRPDLDHGVRLGRPRAAAPVSSSARRARRRGSPSLSP